LSLDGTKFVPLNATAASASSGRARSDFKGAQYRHSVPGNKAGFPKLARSLGAPIQGLRARSIIQNRNSPMYEEPIFAFRCAHLGAAFPARAASVDAHKGARQPLGHGAGLRAPTWRQPLLGRAAAK